MNASTNCTDTRALLAEAGARRAKYIFPITHEQWLAERQKGIGSSEIATIVGLNPYQTPYQLWQQRLGLTPPPPETLPMRLGHLLEEPVAALWHDATRLDVLADSAQDFIVRYDDESPLQVSPDRVFSYTAPDGRSAAGILECKSTQRAVDPDALPEQWLCQVHYQLGVAGLTRGAIAWLSAGRNFGYAFIDFNPELFQFLADQANAFYHENLLLRQQPAPVNAADALAIFPTETPGKTAQATPELYQTYRQLKALRARIKDDEALEAQLADQLKLAIGDAETLAFEGQKLATYKAPKPARRFDAKAFEAKHPELYNEFTIETPAARRFLLK